MCLRLIMLATGVVLGKVPGAGQHPSPKQQPLGHVSSALLGASYGRAPCGLLAFGLTVLTCRGLGAHLVPRGHHSVATDASRGTGGSRSRRNGSGQV